MKALRTTLAHALTLAGLAIGASGAQAGAIITNGTITLGVNDEGHLNTPWTGTTPDPAGVGYVGLRYNPTGAVSTEPGCLCEGWGLRSSRRA